MIPARLAHLLPAILALAACSGDRVVVSDIGLRYSRAELGRAADGRDLRTVVQGNPFGAPGFAEAVAGIMTRTGIGVRTRFATAPGPTALPDYFVSVVVNPQPDANPFDLCRQAPFTTAPAKRPIVVRAAFCITGGEATAVTGYLDDATGPDDPGFVSLVQNLTLRLFP